MRTTSSLCFVTQIFFDSSKKELCFIFVSKIQTHTTGLHSRRATDDENLTKLANK